jgi:beta-phosphoglucomutase
MTPAILFDFNGVIIDDEPQHCDALIATLSEYGYELDRDTYYREYLGFDDRECFRFSFARMGRGADEPALLEAIGRKNRHYERAVRTSMRLVPGASDFIESAALDGIQLGIVSGALRREIELVLDLAALRPHFS